MTIKNTDKNVSAENHEDVVVNASFNNGILTLIRKNLYDESTSAQKNIEVDLSDHKLKLKVITQARLNALKTSTDSDDIKERESYIFLVSFSADEEGVYREYIWIEDDEDFEVIGSTRVDLSNYVQKSDIANNLTTTTSDKVLDARQGKALADSKADSIHTHTKSNITDFAHSHGYINNDGTFDKDNGTAPTTDYTNRVLGIRTGSDDTIKAYTKIRDTTITHEGALANIMGAGSSFDQSSINSAINTRIGTINTNISNKADATHNHSSSNITDMTAVTVTITYTDNTTETLTLFKQINNS